MYDMDRQRTYAGLDIDLGSKWTLFTNFDRIERDGIVVTSRIGNTNVQPLTSVSDVRGPRSVTYDFAEVGIAGDLGSTEFTLSGEWHEEDAVDHRSWSRQSPVSPGFTESEVSRTDWSLRGPGARSTLRSDLAGDDSLVFAMTLHYRHLDRRTVTDSTVRGFDIAEFVTTTDGVSQGTGQTFLADLSLTWQVMEILALIGDLRHLRHHEEQHLQLVDVTNYPGLGSTIVNDRSTVLTTNQEVIEGSFTVEATPVKELTLSAGYGFARENLRLPDLETGDQDFESGRIDTDGVIAGALWKPSKRWTLALDFRGFGMGKTQLNETSPDMGMTWKERVRYGGDGWSVELVGRHRHVENDKSDTRVDSNSASILLVLEPSETFSMHFSQTEIWVDSTALTNFYFAPDPTPVPTRVGFDGRTDTSVLGFVLRPFMRLAWTNDVSFTNADGDFDVNFLHVLSDIRYELSSHADLGLEGRAIHYSDEVAPSRDYDALIGMLYARLRF
jgi:hypothetical protein